MDLPPNNDKGQYSSKTNISTIEELLRHFKTDPLISGDDYINASKSAVYTSDFVPIALSAPAGILRDGDTLIVTYHGGSGEKASKAYPSNAYKQAAAKIQSKMNDDNDTGHKYNASTFDDGFFEAPKHAKQSIMPSHESNNKHVKLPYRSTIDEEDIREARPNNAGRKPTVKTRANESISSLGISSTDHIEAGSYHDAGSRKASMPNDQETHHHDKRAHRIGHLAHDEEVLSSSKNSGTRNHRSSSESAGKKR